MPGLAWLRHGAPVTEAEIDEAAGLFRSVILQPWEEEAAARLKAADPHTTVLAYQCLSSVRVYETGPRYTSGISPAQALRLSTGTGHEWAGYPGHMQQRVWDRDYREEWVQNVTAWVAGSPFDGVMADNDVFDDYYGHGLDMGLIREGIDTLITEAGRALEKHSRILVPNIAEARREPGRWERHSRFGGGLEECLLAWGTRPKERLSWQDCLAQMEQLQHPGLAVARIPGTGRPGDPAMRLALAAAWVFAPEADVAVTAIAQDDPSGIPGSDLVGLDLGQPLAPSWESPVEGVFLRSFSRGWAGINLSGAHRFVEGEFLPSWSGTLRPS